MARVSLSISWAGGKGLLGSLSDTDDSPSFTRILHPERQNLAAVASDRQSVLPLCGQPAIFCGYGPAIFLGEFGIPGAGVKHGFNSESHTFYKHGAGVWAAVVKTEGSSWKMRPMP